MDNRPVVSDLDFESIKNDLVQYFKDRPEFADYEFAGSGLNLLMDILAYNTHYNALAANFSLNESFIDTALVRSNVVSLAKSLNYIPRSARSSSTKITLTVPRIASVTPWHAHWRDWLPFPTAFTIFYFTISRVALCIRRPAYDFSYDLQVVTCTHTVGRPPRHKRPYKVDRPT